MLRFKIFTVLFSFFIFGQIAAEPVTPVVVIGGGPAGLTAGMYTSRAGFSTKIYTGEFTGGQLNETTAIENYPGVLEAYGYTFMQTMAEQAAQFGAEIIEESIVSVDFSKRPFLLQTATNKKIYADSVIVATGAKARKLGVPGEASYWGQGISSCPICDGYFYTGKHVAVVGGGDAAIEKAIHLAGYAKTVTIFVRKDTMRANEHMQKKLAFYPNIAPVRFNKEIREVIGNETGLTALTIQDTKTGKKERFATDGLFLAIGHTPNSELFIGRLDTTSDGYIKVHDGMATSIAGVFAAGEIMDAKYRQAVISAGFGAMAAIETTEWLHDSSNSSR